MFPESTSIEPRLTAIATKLEDQQVGVQVVSARAFKFPVCQVVVDLLVQSPRRFNILEEFVLRAALELEPYPTREEIATLLGLDRLFVDAVCKDLQSWNILETTTGDKVCPTPAGQEAYEQGQVPRPPEKKSIKLMCSVATGQVFAGKTPLPLGDETPLLPGLNSFDLDGEQERTEEEILTWIDLEQVIKATTAAGAGLHVPAEGRIILEATPASVGKIWHSGCGVLVIQDTLLPPSESENVAIRVVHLSDGRPDANLQVQLERWLADGQVNLTDLLTPVPEPAPTPVTAETSNEPVSLPAATLVAHYVQQASAARQAAEAKSGARSVMADAPTLTDALFEVREEAAREFEPVEPGPSGSRPSVAVNLLRDRDIRPQFLRSLEQAKHTIMIVSPWMTEQVVDADFQQKLKELAQRRAVVLMGWGIARTRDREERAPSDELVRTLNAITTREGIQSVAVWWLGNHHNKEFLVDDTTYMAGSHNWLSYRGDVLPRGELTFQVTDPELIGEARQYMSNLFDEAASRTWSWQVRGNVADQAALERCCVTWAAIGKADTALSRIVDLAQMSSKALQTALPLVHATYATWLRLPFRELDKMSAIDSMSLVVPDLMQWAEAASLENEAVRWLTPLVWQMFRIYANARSTQSEVMLQDQRGTWEKFGLIKPGQPVAEAINGLVREVKVDGGKAKPAKKKKRG